MNSWGLHPDFKLQLAFKERPYQGCNIDDAEIVIIGKDANFPKESKLGRAKRKIILEYLDRGGDFVSEKGILHPFLSLKNGIKLFPKNYDFYDTLIKFLTTNNITKGKYCKISIIDIFPLPTFGSSSTEQTAFSNYLKLKMENVILIKRLLKENNKQKNNKQIFIKNNAFNLLTTIIDINVNNYENLNKYKKLRQ